MCSFIKPGREGIRLIVRRVDMRKIAYMIMCHKNLEQVNRLINRLASKKSVCFIHVDAQASFDAQKIRGGGTNK